MKTNLSPDQIEALGFYFKAEIELGQDDLVGYGLFEE